MYWVPLAILRSIISASLIMFLKIDDTPKYVFPIIVNIILGILCITFFLSFYTEYINEFYKPKYYIYSIIVFFLLLLSYYIIKVCPNPAYFRAFVSLEIMIILIYTYYYNLHYNKNNTIHISDRGIVGIILTSIGLLLLSFN
jgi:hypothetical protein